MKSKRWPIAAASVVACAGLLLSGCTGGGGTGPTPPTPSAGKLNADNALDAAGVAGVAIQRVQAAVARVVAAAFRNYLDQPAAGTYPCAVRGTLTLVRPDANTWRYSATDCDTGNITWRNGELQIDAGVPNVGLRFSFKDLNYAVNNQPAAPAQALNGRFDNNIPVATDLGRRSTAELSFAGNARTDRYAEVYIANKASDPSFLQYGFKLQSPRFAHELSAVFDDTSKVLTLQADDASVLVIVPLGAGGARLELRTSATTVPTSTRIVSAAELDSAMQRARQ